MPRVATESPHARRSGFHSDSRDRLIPAGSRTSQKINRAIFSTLFFSVAGRGGGSGTVVYGVSAGRLTAQRRGLDRWWHGARGEIITTFAVYIGGLVAKRESSEADLTSVWAFQPG